MERLARFLGQADVVNVVTGQPLTGAELLEALSAAIEVGRKDDSALTLHLIDQLGLARDEALDLTRPGLNPATTYLDAVQMSIILYDILLGLEAETASSSAPHRAALLSPPAAAQGDFVGRGTRAVNQIKKYAEKLKGAKWAKRGLPVVGALADSLHDALLALGYVITMEVNPTSTHWKHSAGESGRDVKAEATVVFDLGKISKLMEELKKGKLRDVLEKLPQLPEPGPQKNIDVIWRASEGLITKSGNWRREPNSDRTDANGKAVIYFVPKTEPRPGKGVKTTERGVVEAQVSFRSWLNPRKLLDQIGVGPENAMAFRAVEVERHVPLTVEFGGSVTYAPPIPGVQAKQTSDYGKTIIQMESEQQETSGTVNVIVFLSGVEGSGACQGQKSFPVKVRIKATAETTQEGETKVYVMVSVTGVVGGVPFTCTLPEIATSYAQIGYNPWPVGEDFQPIQAELTLKEGAPATVDMPMPAGSGSGALTIKVEEK